MYGKKSSRIFSGGVLKPPVPDKLAILRQYFGTN
jgi:hypothetical protein